MISHAITGWYCADAAFATLSAAAFDAISLLKDIRHIDIFCHFIITDDTPLQSWHFRLTLIADDYITPHWIAISSIFISHAELSAIFSPAEEPLL